MEWGSFELQDFGIAAMADVDEVAMKYNIYRYDSEMQTTSDIIDMVITHTLAG